MNGAPGPLLAFCGALVAAALLASQPTLLVVLAVGTGLLVWRSPGPRLGLLAAGAVSVLSYALLNPFVVEEGDTIIVAGRSLPGGLVNLQVTVEEVAYGAAAGLRIAIVTYATALFVLRCDPDRLTGLASRLAPRSALTVALAARLFPTLTRDAGAMADAARARGLALDAGRRRDRVRTRATLVGPLLATGLERGLEVAEAMTARGYGGGRRTHLPALTTPAVQRALYGPAVGVLVVLAALRLAGAASYSYYPTLGDALEPAALAASAGVAAALAAAGLVLERWSRPS